MDVSAILGPGFPECFGDFGGIPYYSTTFFSVAFGVLVAKNCLDRYQTWPFFQTKEIHFPRPIIFGYPAVSFQGYTSNPETQLLEIQGEEGKPVESFFLQNNTCTYL